MHQAAKHIEQTKLQDVQGPTPLPKHGTSQARWTTTMTATGNCQQVFQHKLFWDAFEIRAVVQNNKGLTPRVTQARLDYRNS